MPTNLDSTPPLRWLLLIQQLPTRPSSARIRTWRRLQQIGSVVLKNSVYVLPHTPQAREDFEWLASEIRAANGQASIVAAAALTAEQETEIRQAFREARSADYEALRLRIQDAARNTRTPATGAGRRQIQRALRPLRDELARIQAIDFFGAAAKTSTEEALNALAATLTTSAPRRARAGESAATLQRQAYRRRVWVTRPRPGVDRMASAWLIRRFIDPQATFRFNDGEITDLAKPELPFDMYGAEFGHHGERCTFETLSERFAITDPAVRHVARIVHEIDLKDPRSHLAEAPVVANVIQGLQAAYPDDHELLQHGMALFAGLYESLVNTDSAAKPRRRSRVRSAKASSRRR